VGNHLVLRSWTAEVEIKDADFTNSEFRVRIFGVPLMMRNKVNYERIGRLLGRLEEVDVRD